ncbi:MULTISPECIES: AraC family transcriptional regulator [Rhodopseudomonas]|uniref:AraC family transcriptional regulator n=1 Tax=Rhodopseudomonas palustris TaxID=1076 RepID=A0A0D7EM65_RHOPL|nr:MULTISPECIES: AraC family transcriptional regulator [Rhodopseudomonas]KIZ41726.1 AraC family transcriptional regulator [Rhodopseudomonas palustris]MDF3809054.1 AraC family transcriptional regulator [Rhodopseudomonas sp. BAL398]WOK18980.1 AraC family transcriptional regulator [Rhodopseudomonas sp. BAL398]
MATVFDSLIALVDRQYRRFGRETPLDGLLLSRAETPSGIIRSVYRPSFCMVLQGAKVSTLGERSFRYHAGQGLLAAIDVPVSARISEASLQRPYLAFSLTVDPAMVAGLLVEQSQAHIGSPSASVLTTADLDAELCEPLARLFALLDTPRDLPILAPLVRREIVWRLLCGRLGPALRQIGLAESHAARIGRATAWIRDHFAGPLRVADLAALAHMSVPSFHRHFKAVTTLTPVQFQKQIRLQQARQLLLTEAAVASVGYAIGYESPSQFTRDYRRLFGVSPGRDGAAMRASLTPEPVI